MSVVLFALLLQHAVIPAKAGYITYFYGWTNVRLEDSLREGQPVRTHARTRIEALLNARSYLRIDERTEVVIEDASLDHIVIRLNSGSIVVEAEDVGRKMPITILSEDLEFRIMKSGLYRFSDGTANVLDGKLDVPALREVISKGRKVTWFESTVQSMPIEKWESHPLERWSRSRTAEIYSNSEPPRPTRSGERVIYAGAGQPMFKVPGGR
jgi:hypothetical protein